MKEAEQRSVAEALILASPEPIPLTRLAKLIPRCTPARARALVDSLNADYAKHQRAFQICEVAGGIQLRTHSEFSSYLQQLQKTRPLRLSGAALETLSIVAYRQPATRAEVEHVRGVDAGPILRGLLEKKLVKIVGHREVPGRPMLYATTKRFLEVFGLADLEDLPTLRDVEELVEKDAADTASDAPQEAGADDVPTSEGAADTSAVSLEEVEIVGKPH